MQLREFIRSHPNREKVKRDLADALGLTNTSSIGLWLSSTRKVPVEYISGIVTFSRGQIQPIDLRPDMEIFHKIGKVS